MRVVKGVYIELFAYKTNKQPNTGAAARLFAAYDTRYTALKTIPPADNGGSRVLPTKTEVCLN